MALTYQKQHQIRNVFSFTLIPYGSDLKEVISAMRGLLTAFDHSQEMEIEGKKVFVCAYTMVIIGDML